MSVNFQVKYIFLQFYMTLFRVIYSGWRTFYSHVVTEGMFYFKVRKTASCFADRVVTLLKGGYTL